MAEELVIRFKKKVQPSPEDRAHLNRLYEEIAGKAAEAAVIFSRVVGWDYEHRTSAMVLPPGIPSASLIKALGAFVAQGKQDTSRAENEIRMEPTTIYGSADGGVGGVDDPSTGT
jgi:hypothetical protein